MKINFYVLSFIILLFVYKGFSHEIKLPDERITGEDIRIEKTRIFPFYVPSFNVILPELREPEEISPMDKTTQKGVRGDISFVLESIVAAGSTLSCHFLNETAEYHFGMEGLVSKEHREMSFNFQRNSSTSIFSAGSLNGTIELPGPEDSPFLNKKRDFFSFNTYYSFIKNPGIPSITQRFYRIDNSDEINFMLLKFQIDRTPFIFETGIERQDVFNENFSSTALYHSIYVKKEQLNIGGTLKAIERYGIRFIPSLIYNINDNFTFTLTGNYKIPDLYRDIISYEYKELINHNITPEEEYKMSIAFHKKFTDTDLYLDISPSYRDNFYGWRDTDGNGLFEPYPQQYWQTAINFILQHKFTDYFTGYFKGEKRFLSEEIDYYPEELFNAGFVVNHKNISWNTWVSYTGERIFSEKKLGSIPVFNTEMVFRKEKQMEWGISVYNITDREYFEVPGYPAEGRNILSFIRFFF